MDKKYLDIRKCKSGKYRIRVRNVADDQRELVHLAFKEVMEELGTEYANVALEALCLHYLTCRDQFSVKALELSDLDAKY